MNTIMHTCFPELHCGCSYLLSILIGWMRKNNRAARAARTLVQVFHVVCQMTTWNFQISGSNDNVNTTVNLSFSIFTSTALLPVHLQRALSTIKDARKKQESQNSHHFPNVYFRVTFSLPLPSLLLKLPTTLSRHFEIVIQYQKEWRRTM